MTRFVLPAILLVVVGVAHSQEKSVEQQINEALMPLPDDLRAGASVIGYDAAGKKVMLRQGTSNIMCTADSPQEGFSVRCYPKVLEGYRARVAELQAEGLTEDELRDTINAEVFGGWACSPLKRPVSRINAFITRRETCPLTSAARTQQRYFGIASH